MISQHQEWTDELEPRPECAEINALRIKFLNEGYRLKFAFIAASISQQMIDHVYNSVKNNIEAYLDKYFAPVDIEPYLHNRYLVEHIDFDSYELAQMTRVMRKRIETFQQQVKQELKQELTQNRMVALAEHKQLVWQKLSPVSVCVTPVEFETHNIDISFSSYINLALSTEIKRLIQNDRIPCSFYHRDYAIEIRSTVGDEFPSILRKMKNINVNTLFLAHYVGHGVTRRQFIDFFGSQGIQVIFAHDVERLCLPVPELHIVESKTLTSMLKK